MRRIRAKFGRLSVVPAAVGVVVMLLSGLVFFALCAWGIETLWARDELVYPWLIGGTVMVTVCATAFGIWRVIVAERRYRRWIVDHCVYCGYSLKGLTISRCTECGKDRRALWRG